MNSASQSFILQKEKLTPIGVQMSLEKLDKKLVVKVTKDSTIKEVDVPTFVLLRNSEFKNGMIETVK